MGDPQDPRAVRNYLFGAALLLATCVALLFPESVRALWPAFTALVLIFVTRNAVLSLGVACLAALLLLGVHSAPAFGHWFSAEGGFLGTFTSRWHYCALIFTLLLGAFAAVIERSNGLLPLLGPKAEPTERASRKFLTSLFGLGLVCFFDGLANALMLGRVARPVADRLRISRAFLAYIVDTTSSAVACLAFLSTWIVTQLSLIADHSPLDSPAYAQFLSSIPYNFYCIFGLFLAYLTIRRKWLIGPMRHRLPEAIDDSCASSENDSSSGQLHRAIVPVLVLLLSVPLAVLLLHKPDAGVSFTERIQQAMNASTVPFAFVIGSALALLTAILFFPPERRPEAPRAALEGSRQLVPALAILLLAWLLGSLFGALGTTKVLSSTLAGWLPLAALPVGVFLAGCLTSFVSGTSWGTMGLLMPLALPLAGRMAGAQELPPEMLITIVPAVIGAVFAGAVFGDHCSPYSDTTIVSALASGVSTHEHTITQLPYALLAAGAAIVAGYLPVALGLPAPLALLLGGGILTALVLRTSRRV